MDRHTHEKENEQSQLNRIELKLNYLIRSVASMATDQATFDSALADFLSDLDLGLQAIQAKLDASGVSVDLSSELQQITDAKAKFDTQVATDTGSAEVGPVEPATPPADTGTPVEPA